MKRIVIRGGKALAGEIRASGSKNAALPIIFSTLVTKGISRISNLPDIGDVRVAVGLISRYGAKCSMENGVLTVDTRTLRYMPPDVKNICKIRASTYLIGACLSRFGEYELSGFGGCSFSVRPIDLHIDAARALGALRTGDTLYARSLSGADIEFSKVSVGATVNAVIMAASAKGTTTLKNYAKEPHVYALIDFLRSAGASIVEENELLIIEGRELSGAEYSVVGDMIEAGTYLTAGLITGARVRVSGIVPEHLSSFCNTLSEIGASVASDFSSVSAHADHPLGKAAVICAPYPAFATDLQPILAPLLAKNLGGSITDLVWSGRFSYLDVLGAFGVMHTTSGDTAFVAPSRLVGASVVAPDLRGGMACVLTALASEGRSEIYSPELILRGYESPVEKLRSLGADITLE